MNSRRQNTNGLFVSINIYSDRAWIPPIVITFGFLVDRCGIGHSYFRDPSSQYSVDLDHSRIQKTHRHSLQDPSENRERLQLCGEPIYTVSRGWENADHPSGDQHRLVFSGILLRVGRRRHFGHQLCHESVFPASKLLAPVNLCPQLRLPKTTEYILAEQAEMQPSETKPG